MTDEERAEEYSKDHHILVCCDCNYYDSQEDIQEAYLAGLKAGRDMAEADLATVAYMQGAERYKPKWHKVEDDLPKDNDEKLCSYGKGKVVARYDREYDCWVHNFNNLETVIPSSVVFAWCEIPKFEG